MGRSQELARRLEEVLLTESWIANTNYKMELESLTRKQATQETGSWNTIAPLTFHVNYYLAGIVNVLKGGALEIRDKYSFDAPPVNSQTDWENLVSKFLLNAKTQFPDCRNTNWMNPLPVSNTEPI